MSEASVAALRHIEALDKLPIEFLMPGHNHLCNALAITYDKVGVRQIDHYDPHLSTIVGIDSAGRVNDR